MCKWNNISSSESQCTTGRKRMYHLPLKHLAASSQNWRKTPSTNNETLLLLHCANIFYMVCITSKEIQMHDHSIELYFLYHPKHLDIPTLQQPSPTID